MPVEKNEAREEAVSYKERLRTIGAVAAALLVAIVGARNCGTSAPAGAEDAESTPLAELAAVEVRAGLSAESPGEAAERFRSALKLYPGHYGATFQLARALDRAGLAEDAQPHWERVAEMARRAGDQALMQMALARLAARPKP